MKWWFGGRWPHWRGWTFWMLGLFWRSHQQNVPLDWVLHMRKNKNQVFHLSKSNNRVTTAWDEKQCNIADCGITSRGWWLNWGVYFGLWCEYQGASELIARTRRTVLTLSFHTHCLEPCCRQKWSGEGPAMPQVPLLYPNTRENRKYWKYLPWSQLSSGTCHFCTQMQMQSLLLLDFSKTS